MNDGGGRRGRALWLKIADPEIPLPGALDGVDVRALLPVGAAFTARRKR